MYLCFGTLSSFLYEKKHCKASLQKGHFGQLFAGILDVDFGFHITPGYLSQLMNCKKPFPKTTAEKVSNATDLYASTKQFVYDSLRTNRVFILKELSRLVYSDATIAPLEKNKLLEQAKTGDLSLFLAHLYFYIIKNTSNEERDVKAELESLENEPELETELTLYEAVLPEHKTLDATPISFNAEAIELYDQGMRFYHPGANQNHKKALEYFLRAAEMGLAVAQSMVGTYYFRALAGEKDYDKAFYWLTLSAAQNHAYGLDGLANCYRYGMGTERDYEKAVELYKKSAELGNPYAAEELKKLGVPYRSP